MPFESRIGHNLQVGATLYSMCDKLIEFDPNSRVRIVAIISHDSRTHRLEQRVPV